MKNSNYQQNTWYSSYKIRSRNTFDKITSTNTQLLMRTEVSNWQQVGFFILTCLVLYLHDTNLQNETQYVVFFTRTHKTKQYRGAVPFARLQKGISA